MNRDATGSASEWTDGASARTSTPTPQSSGRRGARVAVAVAAACLLLAVYHWLVRPWHRTWGATPEEAARRLPGDDLVADPCDRTTRAVTVDAPTGHVWPWIVQLGQGRGGFYSYSRLENLVGADIHNADRIVPELQDLAEGDTVRMAPEDYWLQSPMTAMTVARIDPGRTLVLRGHDGGTWTFHLDPTGDGAARLLVRGRKPAPRTTLGAVARYVGYELPHFVMERGMLRGIARRAEAADAGGS